ncbi:MAG: ankyrin repeat domain-containing protein [Pyrinomonadaceae bacterium]
MKYKIFLVLICFVFLAACGGSIADTMPPEMAKNMLKLKGYDFDEKNYFQAIKNDDVPAVKAFFDAEINPNARNEKGETPLTFAVRNSEFKTIKVLAEKTNISEQDALGQTPLHLALSNNKEEIFDYFLEQGADVNVGGAKGKLKNQTVLYLAVTRGRKDLAQKLLKRGANPNIADSEGGTVLSEACIGAPVNPEIIKMLIEKGANVNQKESNGATPLIYIAANKQTASDNRRTVVKMLLDAGADKKAKDKDGKTALDWAKEMENKDVTDLLK